MSKIFCINDNVKRDNYFLITNKFRGNIIVDDNGWFEGYLKQVNYTYLTFICGIYHPGELLDLYCLRGSKPEIFHGKIEEKDFKGKLLYLGETESDFSHIFTFSKANISEEGIRERIEKCKSKLSKPCSDFYSRVYASRKELNDVLVKTYLGVNFNDDDKKMARDLNNQKREARHMVRKLNTRGGR